MNCPNDHQEMEEGRLATGAIWAKGPVQKLPWPIRPSFLIPTSSLFVSAWRCPSCGHIELVAMSDAKSK